MAPSPTARIDPLPVSVIVADDEAIVRDVTVHMLEVLGLRVIAAGDSRECLRFVQQNDDGIDLLVTDVTMPVLGGHELHDRLVELRPGLPVVFMSGAADPRAGASLLAKPFSLEDLSDAVARALAKGA